MKNIKSLFSFGDKAIEQSSEYIKLTGDMARKCLSMPEFKQYREYYENTEIKVIDELLMEAANFCVSGNSTEKFGAMCLVKLTRLRDLRSFKTRVLTDSQKGKEEKKKDA